MKMKYYLRGLGVGIIISSLLFLIASLFYKPSLSEAELKKAASEQGYTLTKKKASTVKESIDKKKETDKTNDTVKDNTDSGSSGDSNTSTSSGLVSDGNETTTTAPASGGDKVKISITSGEDSGTVAKNLQDFGVVSDSSDFDSYLVKEGYSNHIIPGVYEIPSNAGYSEIANIISHK